VLQVLWRPFLSTGEYGLVTKELDALAERSVAEPQYALFREIQARVEMCVRLEVKFQRRNVQRKRGFTFLTDAPNANADDLPKDTSRAKQARVAAARYLADLNFLEFFLLGCSILICLSGIMFEAAQQDTRAIIQYQADVVTILLVIVIALSFAYYFIFFLAEVTPELVSALYEFFYKNKDLKEPEEEEYDDPTVELQENPVFTRPKSSAATGVKALETEIQQSLEVLQATEHENKQLRETIKANKMREELAQAREASGDASSGSDARERLASSGGTKTLNVGDFAAIKAKKKLSEARPRAIQKRPSMMERAMAYLSAAEAAAVEDEETGSPKPVVARKQPDDDDDDDEPRPVIVGRGAAASSAAVQDDRIEEEDEDEVER